MTNSTHSAVNTVNPSTQDDPKNALDTILDASTPMVDRLVTLQASKEAAADVSLGVRLAERAHKAQRDTEFAADRKAAIAYGKSLANRVIRANARAYVAAEFAETTVELQRVLRAIAGK